MQNNEIDRIISESEARHFASEPEQYESVFIPRELGNELELIGKDLRRTKNAQIIWFLEEVVRHYKENKKVKKIP